jgi:hypothetical protein
MLAPSKHRAPLFGRSTEIEVLTGLPADVERAGAALVVRGDPGIGKSRLLSEAIALAEERQMNVLATRGVQSEAQPAKIAHAVLDLLSDAATERPRQGAVHTHFDQKRLGGRLRAQRQPMRGRAFHLWHKAALAAAVDQSSDEAVS